MTPTEQRSNGANFPLALARSGEQVVISAIKAGKGLSHKLMEQGLRPGITVSVLQKRSGGFVLANEGHRIALGAGMAQKVFVSLAGQDVSESAPSTPTRGREQHVR